MKILNCKFFCLKSFLFFKFPAFFSFKFLFLILALPDFKLCFLFNMKVLGFKTKNLKNKKKIKSFGQKGGCNKTVFFLSTCVLENVKSYRFFLAIFLAIFG